MDARQEILKQVQDDVQHLTKIPKSKMVFEFDRELKSEIIKSQITDLFLLSSLSRTNKSLHP